MKFKCSSTAIDLRLVLANNRASSTGNSNDEKEVEEVVLLDGTRNFRGKICADGTFWSIADAAVSPSKKQPPSADANGTASATDGDEQSRQQQQPKNEQQQQKQQQKYNQKQQRPREITVTLEKLFVPTSTSGGTQTYDALTDFDWGGIYTNDENEVTFRKYDEAQELDVREYASRLGVDIDNLDMKKVDKSMFGAGLGDVGGDGAAAAAATVAGGNTDLEEEDGSGTAAAAVPGRSNTEGFHFDINQATLDQLTKVGLAKEIVQQGDGMEYELDVNGGGTSFDQENRKKFNMLGKDISEEELRDAGIVRSKNIPSSLGKNTTNAVVLPEMWQKSIPVEEAPGFQNSNDGGGAVGTTTATRVDGGILEEEIVESEIIGLVDANLDNVLDDTTTTAAAAAASSATDDGISTTNSVGLKDANSDHPSKEEEEESITSNEKAKDPIDKLTVARLKEILREQGLKVTVSCRELGNSILFCFSLFSLTTCFPFATNCIGRCTNHSRVPNRC